MLQDTLTLFPPTSPEILSEERTLIFFIPGNPGLIEYYRPFLTQLQTHLSSSSSPSPPPSSPSPSRNLVLHGTSLPGFPLRPPTDEPHPPPFTLRETVDSVKRALLRAADEYCNLPGPPPTAASSEKGTKEGGDAEVSVRDGRRGRGRPVRVVLVGHSVGAYVLLEVAEWWRRVQAGEAGPERGVNGAVGASSAMRIVGGVCLFPTVVDLGMSPRGRWISPILLLPGLPMVVSTLVGMVFMFVPTFVLAIVLSLVMMEAPAAGVTAAWLKSRHGVRQTVFLGRHEMADIGADRWSTDIWGSQTMNFANEAAMQPNPKGDRAKLFFLWGENDHWVNNAQRDRLIARRTSLLGQSDEGPPWMEIDTTGLPHAFCVHGGSTQSVARKVAGWIKEVV